jgi:hypothetical protein
MLRNVVRLAVVAACAAVVIAPGGFASSSTTSALTYRGLDADNVGTVYNAKPDGQNDGHFTLALDTGGLAKTVTLIELNSTTGGVWDTVPQGSWAVLGVLRNGKRLNPADENLKDAISGKVTYELYAGDYGYFAAAHTFVAKIGFSDGTSITSGKEGAGPGEESTTATPAPTATTAPPATSAKAKEPHLDGTFAVKQRVLLVKNVFDRKVGDVLDRTWTFKPKCSVGACTTIMSRTTSSGDAARVILRYDSTSKSYSGIETFVGPYTCNGELFLHGESGTITWHVTVIKAAHLLGQLRATQVGASDTSRFSPTPDVIAGGCAKQAIIETDKFLGTRQ